MYGEKTLESSELLDLGKKLTEIKDKIAKSNSTHPKTLQYIRNDAMLRNPR